MELQWFQEQTRRYRLNTVIVGSGAAGFNAADQLWSLGQRDIAIVTDHVKAGTSRNTGSDKQTYYKLTLAGEEPDSVGEMAKTLACRFRATAGASMWATKRITIPAAGRPAWGRTRPGI